MITYLTFFLGALGALFTIINPFSTASVYLSITEDETKERRRQMAQKASVTAAIVLIVFAVAGTAILSFFNITLDAFRIAGGILVAVIGYHMIKTGKADFRNPAEHQEALEKDDVSIVPLAIPMMSGPGAMTIAMVLMGQAQGVIGRLTVILSILVVCALSYLILSKARVIGDYLGHTGRSVVDKIMGLIVFVIGVQFIVNGLIGVLNSII
ncbi:MAG: NAAT family transporter [Candidatus Woesearchaeota archaeon]